VTAEQADAVGLLVLGVGLVVFLAGLGLRKASGERGLTTA